jgi:hypothetical protein
MAYLVSSLDVWVFGVKAKIILLIPVCQGHIPWQPLSLLLDDKKRQILFFDLARRHSGASVLYERTSSQQPGFAGSPPCFDKPQGILAEANQRGLPAFGLLALRAVADPEAKDLRHRRSGTRLVSVPNSMSGEEILRG